MASMRVANVARQAGAAERKAARRTLTCHATRKDASTSRRQLFSLLAGTVGLVALGERAEAVPSVEEMLERSNANKELNDKKRKATSGANLARSRTVTDGTCAFPNNLIGCENLAEIGDVKYLSDDIKLECEGTPDDEACRAKRKGSPPSFLGV
uniref:Uncharacterized protein n=1 Tax=Chloropicon roscoffensis TaxID=1461544 RepID=A0A7S3CD06_9CHLO|eukprot:CAMPEP_0198465078 /NCGR_PEP_ID=MMETSP1456-20131121/3070_1 /TAXON_ID=1461544 ORGANISM="Unidentified sp., Strain RCC1871" /NCGR_SAMPLE_ID=MMETSP1456 /ASSEMBLY_ACC=CAM_ASM_001119 /LENGTH=153 /DNA_ID=CAMNT_0044190875 /DNA_START=110 /DNA_END=571 /DNA_ORIENTATION=+